MVTQQDKIHVYDSNTFLLKYHIDVDLIPSKTREPNQIVAIKACQNEHWLAVMSGKILILDRIQPEQLIIFAKEGNYYMKQYQVELQGQ